jgi:hypothetical protein
MSKGKGIKKARRLIGFFASEFRSFSLDIFSLLGNYKKWMGIFLVCLAVFGIFYFGRGPLTSFFTKTIVVSQAEILRRVALLTTLPDGSPLSVVRVQNPDELRAQHVFYKDVKEGDYIIMYTDKVIIYDLRANRIIGEKVSHQ